MNVKVRIVVDMDDRSIVAIDFGNRTLNSCMLSEGLKDVIYKRMINKGIRFFRKELYFKNSDKIYYILETSLEVHPKVIELENIGNKFKYRCSLHIVPMYRTAMSYVDFEKRREAYVAKLNKEITFMQLEHVRVYESDVALQD